jgi:hypothetical protein
VQDLVGGDVIDIGGRRGTFIGRSDHPTYRGLQLVVWKLDDGTWSFDALSPVQHVGELVSARGAENVARLRSTVSGSCETPGETR